LSDAARKFEHPKLRRSRSCRASCMRIFSSAVTAAQHSAEHANQDYSVD
jgi:hypothetical protein